MPDLTEADIDRIEGDGERNFINWMYDRMLPMLPGSRDVLYARYLEEKPDYIAGPDALTREASDHLLVVIAAKAAARRVRGPDSVVPFRQRMKRKPISAYISDYPGIDEPA